MKQLIVLLGFLCLGCSPEQGVVLVTRDEDTPVEVNGHPVISTVTPEHFMQGTVGSLYYFKDARTGLCFACADYDSKRGIAIATVPEEKIPPDLLIVIFQDE